MNHVRAVLFDFGGVLAEEGFSYVDNERFLQALEDTLAQSVRA